METGVGACMHDVGEAKKSMSHRLMIAPIGTESDSSVAKRAARRAVRDPSRLMSRLPRSTARRRAALIHSLHPPHIRDFDKSEWRADSSGTSDRGRSIPDRAARAVLDRTRSRIGRMVELDRARSDSWITGPPPGANPNFRILQKMSTRTRRSDQLHTDCCRPVGSLQAGRFSS